MCDVLLSAVATCSDPGLVENDICQSRAPEPPRGFWVWSVVYQYRARGAPTCWDLLPSSAWRTACGIALCPSVWVSGVVWALMPQSPEHHQHNMCFVKYSKRYWFFYLTPSQIVLVFMVSLRGQGTWSAPPGPYCPCVHSSVLVSCFSPAGGKIHWFTQVPAASRMCLSQHVASLGTQVQRYCKRL